MKAPLPKSYDRDEGHQRPASQPIMSLIGLTGQVISQGEKLIYHRIAAGVGGRALQSGAADCSRHDGRSKGPTPPRVYGSEG